MRRGASGGLGLVHLRCTRSLVKAYERLFSCGQLFESPFWGESLVEVAEELLGNFPEGEALEGGVL